MHALRLILVALVIALITVASYGLFGSHSDQRKLARLQDDLTREKILLPISEIVPPASAEALEKGRQFLAFTEEFATIDKTSPAVTGLQSVRLTSPGKAAPTAREPSPAFYDTDAKNPKSWPELRAQLQPGLPLLTEARRRLSQPITPPYDHTTSKNVNSFGQINKLAAWLKTAALLSLQEDNIPEAINLLSDLQQVASFIGQPKSGIHVVLSIGLWSFGCRDVFWEILQEPSLTEADLVRLNAIAMQGDFFQDVILSQEMHLASAPYLYAEFKKTPYMPTAWAFTDSPSGLLGSKPVMQIRNAAWPLLWYNGDLTRRLQLEGARVEKIRSSLPVKNWQAFIAANPDTSLPVSDYDLWRFPLASSFSETFLGRSLAGSAFRMETSRQSIITAIALRRYRLAHSHYPDSLDKLVPDYLATLPQDYYGMQPLQYRPVEGDQFLLYSVGENGLDDGGDSASKEDPTKPSMNSGRDIVWPQAEISATPASTGRP